MWYSITYLRSSTSSLLLYPVGCTDKQLLEMDTTTSSPGDGYHSLEADHHVQQGVAPFQGLEGDLCREKSEGENRAALHSRV